MYTPDYSRGRIIIMILHGIWYDLYSSARSYYTVGCGPSLVFDDYFFLLTSTFVPWGRTSVPMCPPNAAL